MRGELDIRACCINDERAIISYRACIESNWEDTKAQSRIGYV